MGTASASLLPVTCNLRRLDRCCKTSALELQRARDLGAAVAAELIIRRTRGAAARAGPPQRRPALDPEWLAGRGAFEGGRDLRAGHDAIRRQQGPGQGQLRLRFEACEDRLARCRG